MIREAVSTFAVLLVALTAGLVRLAAAERRDGPPPLPPPPEPMPSPMPVPYGHPNARTAGVQTGRR